MRRSGLRRGAAHIRGVQLHAPTFLGLPMSVDSQASKRSASWPHHIQPCCPSLPCSLQRALLVNTAFSLIIMALWLKSETLFLALGQVGVGGLCLCWKGCTQTERQRPAARGKDRDAWVPRSELRSPVDSWFAHASLDHLSCPGPATCPALAGARAVGSGGPLHAPAVPFAALVSVAGGCMQRMLGGSTRSAAAATVVLAAALPTQVPCLFPSCAAWALQRR